MGYQFGELGEGLCGFTKILDLVSYVYLPVKGSICQKKGVLGNFQQKESSAQASS